MTTCQHPIIDGFVTSLMECFVVNLKIACSIQLPLSLPLLWSPPLPTEKLRQLSKVIILIIKQLLKEMTFISL